MASFQDLAATSSIKACGSWSYPRARLKCLVIYMVTKHTLPHLTSVCLHNFGHNLLAASFLIEGIFK